MWRRVLEVLMETYQKTKKNLRKRAENRRPPSKRKESRDSMVPTAEVTATAPPWFMERALKPTGEEVSSILLLPVY
jgi:hypothetical protein